MQVLLPLCSQPQEQELVLIGGRVLMCVLRCLRSALLCGAGAWAMSLDRHTEIQTYIHTYIHTYIQTDIQTYIHPQEGGSAINDAARSVHCYVGTFT